MRIEGAVGPQTNTDANVQSPRLSRTGELNITQLHGDHAEAGFRNTLFTFGCSNAALANPNATVTGLTATATPIIGVWNPLWSLVNLVILQASIVTTTITFTAVNPGGFVWVYSVGNGAITTGASPLNARNLLAPGNSVAKAFSFGANAWTALTGMSNNLAVLRASPITGINAAGVSPAVSVIQTNSLEFVDGGIICPPGGVIGLMNTAQTTTVSVTAGILWEEISL